MKVNMTVATLVMIALALAGTLLFGGFQEEPFEIGDWSGVDIARTEAEFAASGSNEDLVLLVKRCAGAWRSLGMKARANRFWIMGRNFWTERRRRLWIWRRLTIRM